MASSFAPLHSRSSYSFLRGASSPEALVRRAAELGYGALGLCDRDSLAAAWRFREAARAADVRPLFGVRLSDPQRLPQKLQECARGGGGDDEAGVTLLARNRLGYATLCELVSARHLREDFALERALLPALAPGVFVLVDDPGRLTRLARQLPPSMLRAELVRPAVSLRRERALLEAAEAAGIAVVASPAARFATPRELRVQRLLEAVRRRANVDRLPPLEPRLGERFLRPRDEVAAQYADRPDALRQAALLADACRVDLAPRGLTFPRSDAADRPGGPLEELRRLCDDGLRWRYPRERFPAGPPPEAGPRLRRELAIIDGSGYSDYFLVVREIVLHARRIHAPIAGRGSGASSLVAYLLGITNVCPLEHDLCFERFLQPHRTSPPDLDIDFCWRVRDHVIDHVRRTYGDDRFAMVCTHITLQPRSAFRAAGRAIGLAERQISRLREYLPDSYRAGAGLPPGDAGEALLRDAAHIAEPTLLRRAFAAATAILGAPSHYSVHPGGVVITPGPIARCAPLTRAAKGVTLTQYEKDTVEAVGLVKLDLLGNRGLSTLGESLRHSARMDEALGRDTIDPEAIDPRDPLTRRLLSTGDTLGIVQLESPAMRRLLRQTRADDVGELTRVLALVRPGAAAEGCKDAYVQRARGLAPPTPLYPAPLSKGHSAPNSGPNPAPIPAPIPVLERVLRANRGLLLYEDDLILVVAALTGLDGASADQWRRRIQKARGGQKQVVHDTLRDLACAHLGPPIADAWPAIWPQLAKFDRYAFCHAHSASYAQIAFANAHLKAHRPLAFWVAALNNNQGMYDKRVYLEAARREGLELCLPCVNRSEREFAPDPESGERGAIRIGLQRIRGLRHATIDALLAERRRGPYEDLSDLLARVPLGSHVSAQQLGLLIRAGALDAFGTRPQMLLAARLARRAPCTKTAPLLSMPTMLEGLAELPDLGDFPAARKAADELELLGLPVHAHPLAELRRTLPATLATSVDLERRVGERVEIVAIADAARRVETARGDSMQFITLEDEHGLFDAILFPDVYRRCRDLLTGGIGPYWLAGVVDSDADAITLRVERAALCRTGHAASQLPLRAFG